MINLTLFDAIPAKGKYNENELWHSSIHAERLNWVGHQLTKPGSWWLKGFARVSLLDLNPGWWGQKATVFLEKLYRTALVICGIVTLPFIILPVLLGAALRSIASLSKRDFIYIKPDHSLERDAPSIKALSFNALLMPEFLVVRNKQRPTMERVHEIAYAILQTKADIVSLQEVFHTEAAEILAQKLRKEGYHVVYNVGHRTLKLNSGLFIASKTQLDDIQFFEHPSWKTGADQHANKGLLLATTYIDGKKYVIANTHLNGGGSKDEFRAYNSRALQVIGITHHINNYIDTPVDGVILSADTNITPTDHDNPRDINHRKTPLLEPEWFLANRLHHMVSKGELAIPKTQSLPEGTAFRKVVKAQYERMERRYKKKRVGQKLKQLINNRCDRGGPFPTALYKHDLQKRNNFNQATQGTTVDLEALPTVGWGRDAIDQPERVDFVLIRKEFTTSKGHLVKEPNLASLEILSMNSKESRLTSDHYGVLATIHPQAMEIE